MDSTSDELTNLSSHQSTEFPTICSVQWVPNHPDLVCVNQSDGWITVCSLTSGPDPDGVQSDRLLKESKQSPVRQNSQNRKTSETLGGLLDKQLCETDSLLYPVPIDSNANLASSIAERKELEHPEQLVDCLRKLPQVCLIFDGYD